MASATDTRLDLQVIHGLWVVKLHKAWLALRREDVLAALKRGKALRRRLAFEARQPPQEDR